MAIRCSCFPAPTPLTQLPMNVGEILRMTQIVTVFDVYENEDEAISAMA